MNKSYWCPRCGKMFMYKKSFQKHLDSKKCTIEEDKNEKRISKRSNMIVRRQGV